MIEIDIQLFLRYPIRKLLAPPVNQSSCLICFCYNFFERAKETNIYEIKSKRLRSQILTCFNFLALLSKKNYGLVKKSNPSEKNVIAEEELVCIDIDDIGNFED